MQAEQTASDDFLVSAWSDRSHLIRQFLDNRSRYEQMCNEVAYILSKRLDEHAIEYAAVTNRAKTLNSFLEKLQRKTYENPFSEITDFAAARIVFLYTSDREKIEKLIESEFEIVEKVDKVEAQESDRFGYGALHYLVHLGRQSSGARYDDLKSLVCEIQVRTVLQDAWAIIDHHLIYKRESSVPKPLRRKINALAGSFETMDDQFDQIRDSRERYIEQIHASLDNRANFLSQELNFDTLAEFMTWRFPRLKPYTNEASVNTFLRDALKYNYSTLQDVEDLLNRTDKAVDDFLSIHRQNYKEDETPIRATTVLLIALGFDQPESREGDRWRGFENVFQEFEDLVIPRAKR